MRYFTYYDKRKKNGEEKEWGEKESKEANRPDRHEKMTICRNSPNSMLSSCVGNTQDTYRR